MFEVAELGHPIRKSDYDQQAPTLRTQLLLVQQELLSAYLPVLNTVCRVLEKAL
jgi:hypothetical protein